MIRFYYRAGSAETNDALTAAIRHDLSKGREVLLLVPEQQTVSTERKMLELLPASAQLSFEVVNFSRLANHTFRALGGHRWNTATPAVRALLMWHTLRELAPTLQRYGKNASDPKLCEMLLQAAKILHRQGTPVNVVLVGGGNKQEIEQEIDALQLQGKVWLHGPCYDEGTNARLLYNAAVCASPGNVGLTAIHALTYGTPVVTHNNFATQMPEAEAITDGITGSLFTEDDAHDLARKIAHWCNITPARRSQCRAAARHTIESEWSTGYQINLLKEIIAK